MLLRIVESIKINCIILILLIFSLNALNLHAQSADSIDVVTYKLNLDLTQYRTKNISGMAFIDCKPAFGIAVKIMAFRLLKLKVDSVLVEDLVDKKFKLSTFSYNDSFLKINTPLMNQTRLKIYYHGSPIKDATWGGFYFRDVYSFNMGVGFSSDPHNFGRVWFPCIDNFTDKALYSYSVKVETGYAAICGGLLKDTIQNSDNTTTWNWEHSYPIPTYLASVASAPYKNLYDNYNGINRTIPILLAAEARDTANLKLSFVNLKNAMKIFEDFYGPYRFERVGYSLVPFDAGAMEHACNIAYPKSSIDGKITAETLMAHELSHHWWGNNVTCKSAGDMWLNEGWASYSEALFTENLYGDEAYHDYMNTIHKGVLQFAHLKDGAATGVSNVSHKNTYGMHVYKKGADMVHTIRGAMGVEAFKERSKSLMETYKTGNITTQDFINHFNKQSLLPPDFIKQIIADTGFCHFSIYNYNSVKEGNEWNTTLNYKQKQRFGKHVYTSIPFEVFAFDNNFAKKVFKVYLGESSSISFKTPFKPEFICFDYNQNFSDAITDDAITTANTGNFDFTYSMMNLSISENSNTSLIRIEHNWVYPDAYFMRIPRVIISKERYWNVDGIFSPALKFSATVAYDGSKSTNYTSGWLDNLLFEGRSEDSIVLLYRENAESYWQIENNVTKTIGAKLDKKGTFKINELKKGQYTFGVYGKALTTGFNNLAEPNKDSKVKSVVKMYPNPSNGKLNIEWNSDLNPESIQIFDILGKSVLSKTIESGGNSAFIDMKLLQNGHYFAALYQSYILLYSEEFIIER